MKRHLLNCRLAHCFICWVAMSLVALHPFIHGTPFDSGALDALLVNLQALALSGGDR